jgi:Ca-activated chloride channel family protein
MSFGATHWFWALLALPVLIFLFVRAERKTAQRLRIFISARLLPELAGQVNRWRRVLRFVLQLLALALAIVSLAKPRWGYSIEEAHRRGIDILIAVDTSRSMLSNDVQPSRLERVKLSTQDLINQLEGDRVGLIAFAGRAFVQAPLTIDYGAVIDAIRDLNTQTIPEGGTNISEAIDLAAKTYGKSATGNRALVIFTDGEDLSGDAIRAAKAASDQGVRIFTVGVGTPQGSLIPIKGEDAQNVFVKDEKGQVVKSKLDEKRLREIAETTGGIYLHLENGTRTMQQLALDGIAKMQAGDIDVRLNRRPIERYEWPLGMAVLCLVAALLLRERRRQPTPERVVAARVALGAIMLAGMTCSAYAAAPGIDSYNDGKFEEAYGSFQATLQAHPQNPAIDRLNFDAGAASYKLKDYNKALQSFSQALLSQDVHLQERTHYNLGNTLYQQGETEKADDKKLANWTNAIQHYDETLKIDPQDKQAQENREFVRKKIEELKNKKTPPPSQSSESGASKPPPEPSEAAKRAKQEADKAVMRREYRKALDIMTKQLSVDPTTEAYADYIQRLKDINGIGEDNHS